MAALGVEWLLSQCLEEDRRGVQGYATYEKGVNDLPNLRLSREQAKDAGWPCIFNQLCFGGEIVILWARRDEGFIESKFGGLAAESSGVEVAGFHEGAIDGVLFDESSRSEAGRGALGGCGGGLGTDL
jgi:hypothetical protein